MDVRIDAEEKRLMDVHVSQIKVAMDLGDEMRKMLQAKVDKKVVAT